MPEVLILADDLSGAADCGIACVKAGLDAEVWLGPLHASSSARIVAIDANTRVLQPEAAARRMYELALAWTGKGPSIWFKKIDSTLRGHIGPELTAVLAARREHVSHPIAFIAPAFPANGRTTIGGTHQLHGEPLHTTEMWRYEKMRGDAYIPRMLEGAGLRCSYLNLATVRDGLHAGSLALDDADVVVCDAISDDDLKSIARLAAHFGERAVWVGSAGLAHQLAEATGLQPEPGLHRPEVRDRDKPALFVMGSATRRTREQSALLLSSSDIFGVVVAPEVLLAGPGSSDWEVFARDLVEAIRAGQDVILLCDSEPVIDVAYRGQLSLALAEMTAGLRDEVGTLIASGGETARKVLDRWGVQRMRLRGELELGVPLSTTALDGGRELAVITKAGDFGKPDTLLNCLYWVNQGGLIGQCPTVSS